MSLEIIGTPEAVDDVIKAADYIAARFSLNASDKFLEAVKSTYRQISEMPGMGVWRCRLLCDSGKFTAEGHEQ